VLVVVVLQSQVASFGMISAKSGVVRTVEQQAALEMLSSRHVALQLQGFVFFGSANAIGKRLHELALQLGDGGGGGGGEMGGGGWIGGSVHGKAGHGSGGDLTLEGEAAKLRSMRSVGEGFEKQAGGVVAALANAPRRVLHDVHASKDSCAWGVCYSHQ
jgi:hypothetical protein